MNPIFRELTKISRRVKRLERILASFRGGAKGGGSPAGMVSSFAGSVAPDGWLFCRGQAVSRADFSGLFSAIGTQYGTGNGSTTFNVPNLNGRVPVGFNSGETEFNTLGKTGGAKTHTLTVAQLPSHSHSGSSNSTGAHTHTLSVNSGGAHTHTASSASAGAHTHSVSASGTLPNHRHDNYDSGNFYLSVQPGSSVSVNGTLRTFPATGGSAHYVYLTASSYPSSNPFQRRSETGMPSSNPSISSSGTAASNGAHSHTITVNSGGSHTHTGTASSAGAHSHTITIGDTGSGSAHPNLQPYIALNFIIKI